MSAAYTRVLFRLDYIMEANENTMNPDQIVSFGKVWSESILFTILKGHKPKRRSDDKSHDWRVQAHDLASALIRVDSRFQRTLNRTCVQRIENAHETRICSTNTRASVYKADNIFR